MPGSFFVADSFDTIKGLGGKRLRQICRRILRNFLGKFLWTWMPESCKITEMGKGGILLAEKILVADDEREITELIALYLENEHFTVFQCHTAQEALDCIDKECPDLAILDVMLPDRSGFEICRRIRREYTFPVIMLTAKIAEVDRITGLTLGADDYVTKPFLPLELVARVKAQLRRYTRYNAGAKPEEDVIGLRGLVLNIKTHECTLNEKPLALTPTEFGILTILCRNPGSTVSSEALFHGVWGEEYYSKNNNTITVHIRHLREKMGDSFECPKYIKTVWGVGYKIEN